MRESLREVAGRRFWARGKSLLAALALFLLVPALAVPRGVNYWMQATRDRFDVIVVGGEPEGVAAAVAAARSGAWTLLVEPRDGLGGLMTYGMLNSIDMNWGPDGKVVTRGIFQEFLDGVQGDSFDVARARQVFNRLVRREWRLVTLLETEVLGPVLSREANTILGVRVRQDGRERTIFGARVIDATQDADVAAASGAPYTLNAEDRGLKGGMAATLVLHVGGVNWQEMVSAVKNDGDPETGFTKTSVWGFKEMLGYKSSTPRIRVRAPNIGLQRDGTVLINAVQVFHVDGLDPASRAEAVELVKAEAPRIVDYMRDNLPGFGQAFLVGTAPELYIRESRHILGEYQLTINDVLENRDFPDRIGFGSYPVDIQATGPDNWGWAVGRPAMYSIPFRSLVPLKVDNLLVVGRAASFTSLAAGSARVIPVGMVSGQAAGVAAAYSLREGITPRELALNPDHVSRLQERLKAQGAYLKPFTLSHPLEGQWAIDAVRVLRPLGIISAGYKNDYQLDQFVSPKSFLNLTWEAFKRRGYDRLPERRLLEELLAGETVTPRQAVLVLQAILDSGQQVAGGEKEELPSWLGEASRAHMGDGEKLTRALAYSLVADALTTAGLAQGPPESVIRVNAVPQSSLL